jgi:hypothetical protein
MRTVVVVLGSPVGDEHLSFEERVELLDGQQFVPDPRRWAASVGLANTWMAEEEA